MMKQYGSLETMEEELSKYNFLRINPRYIADIGRQEIFLTDGTSLEMGRDRRKALLQAMHKYEGEYYGVK